ncbi:hypothetical protein BVRB_5g110920 [Beta vulgaris subsp. vulgaris]|nr:hypothetical protein BVRB_5g110920 [Beta vulgaris subsp. vulgaris]
MPCSRKEALIKLFYYVTSAIKFFFLFFYLFSLFFAKLFTYFFRTDDEYEDEISNEDDDEDEDEEEEEDEDEEDEYVYYSSHVEARDDHLVADILNDGEALVFLPKELLGDDNQSSTHSLVHNSSYESLFQDPLEEAFDDEMFQFQNSPNSGSEFDHNYTDDDDIGEDDVDYEVINEEFITTTMGSNVVDEISELIDEDNTNKYRNNNDNFNECGSVYEEVPETSPRIIEAKTYGLEMNGESNYQGGQNDEKKFEVVKEDSNFTRDEKFLIFDPPTSEAKKLIIELEKEEGLFEDTYTVGSTSKSSSEWRSSIRDSGTDDPFSSSSRRSCPKWESYAVYQKYDEEMMFLDRISAQKLHETESLRSIQVEPRSISQRIVHKLANKKKRSSDDEIYKNNPYNELELAYVAQICLTWEALNWNYVSFQRKRDSKTEALDDNGCPAHIAQQFQQFQVLLQRYVESEPYERGKRPQIYARMRSASPKLLQVPEYHDYEGEEKEVSGRIASEMFLKILEDAIQTFMNFLKADRESHCQVITALLFKARPRGSTDPTVINVVKKHNKKKKLKLRELQRTSICFRKRNLTREEEMEILMGLIDLKVVSRVLRMAEITQEQLHWCDQKMGKLRLLEGKLQRDSSPLFFPAH